MYDLNGLLRILIRNGVLHVVRITKNVKGLARNPEQPCTQDLRDTLQDLNLEQWNLNFMVINLRVTVCLGCCICDSFVHCKNTYREVSCCKNVLILLIALGKFYNRPYPENFIIGHIPIYNRDSTFETLKKM